MGNRFASAKNSIAQCDRCGFRFKLTALRKEIIKTKTYNLLVCDSCWDPDQPQLQLGMYPVDDPQAVRNPRRDTTYVTAGPNAEGFPTGGSREIQWGWNPVGGSSFFDDALTPNTLVTLCEVGQVTIYPFQINYTAVIQGILQAATAQNPGYTAFDLTKIGGRSLGDINNNGSVTSGDAASYASWVAGTLTDPARVLYIEGTLNPYILANPVAYAPYLYAT